MVIVLIGPAGAGKTTIGRALAADLGWRFVDGDDLHSSGNRVKINRGIPLTDADREPWLAALHDLVARAVDRREPLVLACSALARRYRDAIRAGLSRVRFVYLRATRAELERRLADRVGHFAGPGILASQLATLEEPNDAETIAIDAGWPPEQIVGAIRGELGV